MPKGSFIISTEAKGQMCFAPLANPAHNKVWVAPISRVHSRPFAFGSAPEQLLGFTWLVPILQASLGTGDATVVLIIGLTTVLSPPLLRPEANCL